MKYNLIVILFLTSFCFGAYAQEAKPLDSQKADSITIDKGLIKISVMYPYSEGKTFDMNYYETKHMPMVAAYLGSNLVKYTIEKGVASGIPNQPLPYMAIGTFYVKSLKDYQEAIGPNRDAIRADFPNYTNVTPIILVSEVIR